MRLYIAFLTVMSSLLFTQGKDEEKEFVRKNDITKSRYINPGSLEPGDLNIRFNKIPFPDGEPEGILPLGAGDYPIRGPKAKVLKARSVGDCIMTEDDYALNGKNTSVYVELVGGAPTYPNSYPLSPFWDEMREVVSMQLKRRRDIDPNLVLPLPDLWKGMDIHQVAEAVHNEYPGLHQQNLIKKLWSEGVRLDPDIIPFRSRRDFVGLQVGMANLNTWAISVVSPINFHLKWSMGRPRPEEVAWMIATGESTHGVPVDIEEDIRSMMLRSPADFTGYKEGSPTHPSWPAMHSAASSASMWLAVVLDELTSDQYCEALRVDYAVAYARTVAGVHYPTDNIAGLNLGQIILKENLPDYLVENFDSDRDAVEAKIDGLLFDWEDFDPWKCTIKGEPVRISKPNADMY